MRKSILNPAVDGYFSRTQNWGDVQAALRVVCLDCGLTEELKWGKPCYSSQGKVVVVIQGFKEYCALLFFKGYLLKDPKGVLVKTGENTRVGRQIRFANVKEVTKLERTVKAYIQEAIDADASGVKVAPKKVTALVLAEEFQNTLHKKPALKKAFYALTPGRQRAYNIYFSQPKQAKTRESRIEKCTQDILNGKGLND